MKKHYKFVKFHPIDVEIAPSVGSLSNVIDSKHKATLLLLESFVCLNMKLSIYSEFFS